MMLPTRGGARLLVHTPTMYKVRCKIASLSHELFMNKDRYSHPLSSIDGEGGEGRGVTDQNEINITSSR